MKEIIMNTEFRIMNIEVSGFYYFIIQNSAFGIQYYNNK